MGSPAPRRIALVHFFLDMTSDNPQHTPSPHREVWLRTNVRALTVAMAVCALAGLAGVSAVLSSESLGVGRWLQVAGGGVIVVAVLGMAALAYQMTLPRLAYEPGYLLVYLESSEPTRVPIEIVELFFLGHGESHVPATSDSPAKSRTVVVRLAEGATEWHSRPTRPQLGEWRDGYIILRGTWCEPLTHDVLKGLNRRLAAIHRERRAAQESNS